MQQLNTRSIKKLQVYIYFQSIFTNVIFEFIPTFPKGHDPKIANGNTADAFHALSEGYGFIMSLQFTNDGTGNPYFSNSEVNAFLASMDNFWTVENSTLESIRDEISSKFGI